MRPSTPATPAARSSTRRAGGRHQHRHPRGQPEHRVRHRHRPGRAHHRPHPGGWGEITPDTPRLGVTTVGVETVEDEVRDRLGIDAEEGAFVYDVLPGSGAEAAGIRPGDVIVAVDGEAVTSNERLGELIGGREPGDAIEVRIEREGEEQTLTAEVGRQGG